MTTTLGRLMPPEQSPDDLATRLKTGDVRALARALTLADIGGPDAQSLLHSLRAATPDDQRHTLVVGFTGPPGAGKSTLISACIRALRDQQKTVATLAVDPSSPRSGGAILGDRARMGEHGSDPGVFIRSVASRGHLGGLALNIQASIDILDAAGFDIIILETVGAGQSEVEVARIADVTVVISAPGLGDELQAIKAGILEIADVLVVNKADLPGARNTAQQLSAMLTLRSDNRRDTAVISTVATSGEGVDDLIATVIELGAAITPTARAAKARAQAVERMADAAAALVRQALRDSANPQTRDPLAGNPPTGDPPAGDPPAGDLIEQVRAGTIDPAEAARRLLK